MSDGFMLTVCEIFIFDTKGRGSSSNVGGEANVILNEWLFPV